MVEWGGAALLTCSFASEEELCRYAARLPAGMATLYAHGEYRYVNCLKNVPFTH